MCVVLVLRLWEQGFALIVSDPHFAADAGGSKPAEHAARTRGGCARVVCAASMVLTTLVLISILIMTVIVMLVFKPDP